MQVIYRVAHKKRPELCFAVTVRILYGENFPFAHLYTSLHCYLIQNFSDVINEAIECRLMT